MCIHRRMYQMLLRMLTDIILPGLDLQRLWRWVFIVPIIMVIMEDIMAAITVDITT